MKTTKMKKLALIALSVASIHATAFAGAESHGGQIVSCPNTTAFSSVLLDYYEATLPTEAGGAPQLVDISTLSSNDVLALVKSRLQGSAVEDEYERALALIGPLNTWLESSLQAIPDSEPAFTLPTGCVLDQVAVRQDSTMYVNPALLRFLSPAQQGLLVVHEALYYVAQQHNMQSSVEVRTVIRNLLMKDLNISALSRSIHEMGATFFWWENFTNRSYRAISPDGRSILFWLGFDPLVDGDVFKYELDILPSNPVSGSTIEQHFGHFEGCNDSPGACQTLQNELTKCSLSAFMWKIGDNSSTPMGFRATCADLNIDIELTDETPQNWGGPHKL